MPQKKLFIAATLFVVILNIVGIFVSAMEHRWVSVALCVFGSLFAAVWGIHFSKYYKNKEQVKPRYHGGHHSS